MPPYGLVQRAGRGRYVAGETATHDQLSGEYPCRKVPRHMSDRRGPPPRTRAWHWRWALLSFVLVAIHAGLDEYHQAYTQFRTSSVADSVLDMAGGLIALACLWLNRRKPAGLDHHGSASRYTMKE